MKDANGASLDSLGRPRTICPVTLSALAIAADNVVARALTEPDDMNSWLTHAITARSANPATIPAWRRIEKIEFRVWADQALICGISLTLADGDRIHWSRGTFSRMADLPATIATALVGRPVSAYIDHPLFAGTSFVADDDGLPATPPPTVPIDAALPALIAARRLAIIASMATPANHAPPRNEGRAP